MELKFTAYLRVLNGPERGRVFVLKDIAVFEIGRAPSCHIQLDDPSVSNQHGRIYRKEELWTFYDLNSEGGSAVNDIRVDKRVLEGGEIIRVGSFEMQFTFNAPVRRQPEAPAAEETGLESALGVPPVVNDGEAGPDDPSEFHRFADLSGQVPNATDAEAASPVPPGAEDVCLKVIDGDEADVGKELVLDPTLDYIIGRSEQSSLVLSDGKVSRLHCRIECNGGEFVLTDLNSANGTIVNGERVNRAVLRLGDYLRLGFTILSYEKVPVASV